MNESMIVYGVVLGAAAYVALRFAPANLRARFGLGGGKSCASGSCSSKDGTGGCDGCH